MVLLWVEINILASSLEVTQDLGGSFPGIIGLGTGPSSLKLTSASSLRRLTGNASGVSLGEGQQCCQHAGGVSGADPGHRREKGSVCHQLAWLGFLTLQVFSRSEGGPAWETTCPEVGVGGTCTLELRVPVLTFTYKWTRALRSALPTPLETARGRRS